MSFFRSPLFPIFMVVFVDALGFGITLPVLPLYMQGEFGATATQVAGIASFYFVAQFLAAPQVGRWSDHYGRRPLLIASQMITFISFLLSGLATSLPFLYFARAFAGLAGGNISVAQAYLSDVTEPTNRARSLGVINAGFSTGFVFGPAFGSFIAASFGPRVPFFIGAAVACITIALAYLLMPESLTPEKRQHDAALKATQPHVSRLALLRSPAILLIMVMAFGLQFAFFNFQSMYVLWAERVMLAGYELQQKQQIVGATYTFVGIVGIITQVFVVGFLVKRVGERAMVAGGSFMRAVAWSTMSFVPVLGVALLVIPLFAMGGGITQPALIALLTYSAPPGQRGQVIGLLEGVQSLGRISGPLVAGFLYERLDPSTPLLAAGLTSALVSVMALGLWRAQTGTAHTTST